MASLCAVLSTTLADPGFCEVHARRYVPADRASENLTLVNNLLFLEPHMISVEENVLVGLSAILMQNQSSQQFDIT